MKKRALDLFCGGGGASAGLVDAGFEVVGVDLYPQRKYPFQFIQADALSVSFDGFDFIWASPVCKRFSSATRTSKTQENWPDQIGAIRERLVAWGGDWCIENVKGAPLQNSIMLCGAMFGLRLYLHRYFETSIKIESPMHEKHTHRVAKMGRPVKTDEFINPVGHFSDVPLAQVSMGISWMGQKDLSQAIPPAYSHYIATQLNRLTRK